MVKFMLIIETRCQWVGSKNILGTELAWEQYWALGASQASAENQKFHYCDAGYAHTLPELLCPL